MEASFIILPTALIIILLATTSTLTPKDFQRIITELRAIFTGLFC